MDLLTKIEEKIAPSLEHMGYGIVRLQIMGLKRRTLQIMIENLDGRPIAIEHCEEVSRYVSVLLDQFDPLSGQYNLEVSSPGLDRPLVKLKDFQRFAGNDVVVKTYQAIDNSKTFIGRLESANETDVTLTIKIKANETITRHIPFSDIKSARLHVTFN